MYNNYNNSGMRSIPPCCRYMMYRSDNKVNPENMIMVKDTYDDNEIFEIASHFNINLKKYDVSQFKLGLETEVKLARIYLSGKLNRDFLLILCKMVATHLDEIPDYYSRLLKMKLEAGVSIGFRY